MKIWRISIPVNQHLHRLWVGTSNGFRAPWGPEGLCRRPGPLSATSGADRHPPGGRAPTPSGSHESMPSWEPEPENLEIFENS